MVKLDAANQGHHIVNETEDDLSKPASATVDLPKWPSTWLSILIIVVACVLVWTFPEDHLPKQGAVFTVVVANQNKAPITMITSEEEIRVIWFNRHFLKHCYQVLTRGTWMTTKIQKQVVKPNTRGIIIVNPGNTLELFSDAWGPNAWTVDLPQTQDIKKNVAAIVVDAGGSASIHDKGDIQAMLSVAARACKDVREDPDKSEEEWEECLGANILGGVSSTFVATAWYNLWSDHDLWKSCESAQESASLRSMKLASGAVAEVYRETPLVAIVRNAVTPTECTNALAEQQRAIVKGGSGLSDAPAVTLLQTKAIDMARDFFHKSFSKQGQEPMFPIQFMRGWQSKWERLVVPDEDTSGDRVASAFFYCQAASAGGSLIFPEGAKIPTKRGDMVMFHYLNEEQSQLAFCPLGKGNQTLFVQHVRKDVSAALPYSYYERLRHERAYKKLLAQQEEARRQQEAEKNAITP